MAEEAQYASDTGSNKRKYDEQTAPPRRPTGFSAPISSTSPDDGQAPISHNCVPPPAADDVDAQVQSAKQRVQEIASRLLLNASVSAGSGAVLGGYETKRARVENGGGFDLPNLDGKPAIHSAPSAIPVYNFPQNTSKKIDVPNGRVGVIIGKSGETIKNLQVQSGAKIQVTRDMDADRTSLTRPVELTGTPEQIARAEQLISDVLAEAEAGGSGLASRRMTGQAGSEQFVMRIPNNKVGLVIGKGGETIKIMQASTGARIQVVPLHPPPGDTSTERSVHIDGTQEQIEAAKQLVNDAISENRMRNSSMGGGGYNQQHGYQVRPQTSWGAAPQMQQQAGGYGYVQPGAYPGAPHYPSQAQYGGYPTQAAAGGYDQSSAAITAQQQGASGGGYDYYNQQQQQQPPSQQQQQNTSGQGDQSAGGYNNYNSQAPAASYPQQGSYYGGYNAPQSGYAQYDHQQQQGGGYSSAAGYGGTQDASGYGAQGGDANKAPASVQPPAATSQPGYGVPPATSQGYGPPPTQKLPANAPPAYAAAYGQSQQSPTTPGGGYGQAPAAVQAQAGGYLSTGYGGAPAYGGPPPPAAPQTGYGQQQQSAYGSGYGSSTYPQAPPAYYGDGSGTASAAPPASQTISVAATTAPKASPKS